MQSPLICCMLTAAMALLLCGGTVDAWNRQLFNRYSRNLLAARGNLNAAGGNNEIDEFSALFGLGGGDAGARVAGGVGVPGGLDMARVGVVGGNGALNLDTVAQQPQQQAEVYGIVEPLIEDMPCVDRPCNMNDDCCPTGVCVNTYGEGKCIYVYGRKRDLCHRNQDCEPGMSCLKGGAGNMVCQPTPAALHLLGLSSGGGGGIGGGGVVVPNTSLELKQYGEDCVSSNDCNVAKGMCCQLQRSHHRVLPKKMCYYFRDPFMCIDIMPTEDEMRESRFLSSFSQRRM